MDFHDLQHYLTENKINGNPFEIRLSGETTISPISRNRYIYFEQIAYIGHPVIESEYMILHTTENEINILIGSNEFAIDQRKIRPYIESTFHGRYNRRDCDDIYGKICKYLGEEKPEVLLVEFGLMADRNYYARLDEESYFLPPGKGRTSPVRKSNPVLIISDRPIDGEPQGGITPYFSGFSY